MYKSGLLERPIFGFIADFSLLGAFFSPEHTVGGQWGREAGSVGEEAAKRKASSDSTGRARLQVRGGSRDTDLELLLSYLPCYLIYLKRVWVFSQRN